MFDNLSFFPDSGSSVARHVDALYFYLVAVSAFFATLITILIIVFAIKYRRRSEEEIPPVIIGSLRLELIWTIIPLFLAMTMFFWGAVVYFKLYHDPKGAMDVYVVGKQWMWKFQHMGGQREINELHVPVGRVVKLTMASEDVIHSFFVPDFRIKADVVPGRYRTVSFEATKPGSYRLFCAEYCGTKHAGMLGRVIAMEPRDYEVWLSGGRTMGSLAATGEKLFQDLACHTCHRQDATGRGPVLSGLFGKEVKMTSGETVKVDENYIRESIVNPHSKTVAGYQPIMPTYQGQISEEGLLQLIAYIRSLGAPETEAPMQPSGPTPTQPQAEPQGEQQDGHQ